MAEWLGTSRLTCRRFEKNLHWKAPRDKGLEIRALELTGIPVNKLHYTLNESNLGKPGDYSAQTYADVRVGLCPYGPKKTPFYQIKRRRRKKEGGRDWSLIFGVETG
jgi:hypothetical protein